MIYSRIVLCFVLLFSMPVHAQAPETQKQPIEITASKTVEWLRDKNQYVARENVVVTQGAMSIHADLLIADYRETPKSSTEIQKITAEGNVEIKDAENTAYGDRAVYDVPNSVAILTGKDLKIVSPEHTITATDRMEYHANERLAKAIGNAKVVHGQDTLTANTLTAFFKETAPETPTSRSSSPDNGHLDRLEADGSVVIQTPKEILRGKKGVYHASTNKAELTGDVRIERGENVLEGQRAEIDLATHVSKMFGSDKPNGRVRGVFFPSSQKQ